ncbi:MAG TPA: hypothetical protein ENO18_03535, partial [Caldithrix sp.]|nr:hypothetical protein [Caldithrix sp.]
MRFQLLFFSLCLCFSLNNAQPAGKAIVSRIVFEGDFKLSDEKMSSAIGIAKNNIFDPSLMKPMIDKLIKYYYEQGYLYAQVDSVTRQYSYDNKTVNLNIYGHSGYPTYYGKINIFADSLDINKYIQLLDIKENDRYAPVLMENNFTYLLNYAADQGYPFTKIEIENISFNKIEEKNYADVTLRINEGKKIYIKGFQISGNVYTNDNVILRELYMGKKDVYSKTAVDEIPAQLMRLQIFKDAVIDGISLIEEDSVIINIGIEEGNSIMVDGVIGYVPEKSGTKSDGNITGLFNLSLKNIFGTGRKFDVHWQKPDTYSEEFNLRYTEPWVLDYPVAISIGLDRTVRDSSFIKWDTFLNTRVRILKNLSAIAGISRKLAYPDSVSSRNNRLLRNEVINLELGLEYDTRDYPINPRSGLFYSNSYAYGFKNNYGPSYILIEDSISSNEELQTLQLEFGWYYNLWSNQVVSIELNGKQIKG